MSHVTIFTTVQKFHKGRVDILVVIILVQLTGSDQFCSAHREQAKIHQVLMKNLSSHHSLNSLQEDGCLVVISGAAHRERPASPRPIKVRRVMSNLLSHANICRRERHVGKHLRYREGSRKKFR